MTWGFAKFAGLIGALSTSASIASGAPATVQEITDDQILAIANERPFRSRPLVNGKVVLGINRGMTVVVDTICLEQCSNSALHLIHYDKMPGPLCERAGGVSTLGPYMDFPDGKPKLCTPKILTIPSRARPAMLLPAQRTLASLSDYPGEAIRLREEGRVRFVLRINVKGQPTNCSVMSQINSKALRMQTCRLAMERLRFRPALNYLGNPTGGSYQSEIIWVLPDFSN